MSETKEAGAKSTNPSVSSHRREDQISDLRKQRGNMKGRLTQFKKYVDSFQTVIPTRLQLAELKLRMQAATEVFKKFNVIQSEIELCTFDTEAGANYDYVESIEMLYFGTMAIAGCLVEGVETKAGSESAKFSNLKLPQIKLPTFDGSYDRWLEFKNSYETMIHNRSDLDEIQKFHYLRSALSGSALQVISALEFTASNYLHAWDLLEIRFHNPRLLVHNHVKSLFNISPLKQESSILIRKLIDTIGRNLRALQTLDEPTDSWDTLLIYLIVSKLDSTTERKWESHIGSLSHRPNNDESLKIALNDLLSFLRNRADTLEMINSNHSKPPAATNSKQNFTSNKPTQVVSCVSANVNSTKKPFNNKRIRSCVMCNGNHALYACVKFLNLPIQDRLNFVRDKNLCNNCLREGHSLNECLFGPCKQCQQKHNSLLHVNSNHDENVCVNTSSHCASSERAAATAQCIDGGAQDTRFIPEPVLLSTALIEVADENNRFHTARALLDNGSEHCFITENLCKRLNMKKIQSTIQITGVGQSVTQSNYSCDISIRSKINEYYTSIKCIVLPRITYSLPSTDIDFNLIRIPDNIQLADSTFDVPSCIDILIGAEKFWELLDGNRIRLSTGPYLQNSKLGWLLSGPIYTRNLHINNQVQCNFTQTIDAQLRKFWELEDISQVGSVLTADERKCEELFTNTTKREIDGRFSVRIPLRESTDSMGHSYTLAKNRFLSLERKLERLPEYKRLYCDFMREYEAMGHMTRVDEYDDPNYFLPHHGVFKASSSTTKLRVVFDGSAATTSNKSLNDIQLPGPALQNDIFSILLRFRQYKYVACADVEKMFRQVLIQPDQRSLQMILWREKPTEPLHTYQLNTVTYGTASAPFLSMRCIRQLALECGDDVIARVITHDIFVDDLITGNDDFQTLLDVCQATYNILQSGCFPLRKWTFNRDVTHDESKEFLLGEHTQNKTLGLGWDNASDELYFTTKIDQLSNTSHLNKRIMLSIISQIYDPLGLLSPAVIISKIILQKLWLSKIDWDTAVSRDIAVTWQNFIDALNCLSDLRIPRYVRSDHTELTELHIFSDASQQAYGACAYIRTYDEGSAVSVKLLCGKSKVAPLKSLTIPRLELSAALVGARLYKKIIESLRLMFTNVYFWTDSTIVLSWIRMAPHLLKPFVQNRVTEINELTSNTTWLHVNSENNPADLLSRGLGLDKLINCNLWWNGPSFLYDRNSELFSDNCGLNKSFNNLPELRKTTVSLVCNPCNELFDFYRYSSYIKLVRISAYVLRFIQNLRNNAETKQRRQTGSLSADELCASRRMLVRFTQRQSFPDVYENLLNNKPIHSSNKQFNRISGLNVFLDEHKVIRVGGRLCNSTSFDYNKKHPMLLCSKNRFTVLLFDYEHKRLLHAGPQLLLSTMRECWWPLGARNLAKKTVRQCVVCIRLKGKTLNPIMGNHVSERLEPGFPFIRTAVDYCGPMFILNRKGRGAQLVKSYVCLFICMVTRAIHLELVTSLSTDDYLLALKRFISRRGKPHVIFSDNGKNFVGAEKELSMFFKNNSQEIVNFTANDSIKFSFIPPYSPHFAGFWEAGIKSCKYHLRRVVGNARLTYEEFSTVLTQIEAVLNSRPMSPMSTDPSDLSPLTPAHFLIGRPLTSPASEDLTAEQPSRLSRYARIELLRQHFWQRWAKEYIAELQLRTKWKTKKDEIILDSLVLIKDDNLPPLKWRLGRVTRLFPGKDGVSRVADIRTATGTIRRAFSKICPLLSEPTVKIDT